VAEIEITKFLNNVIYRIGKPPPGPRPPGPRTPSPGILPPGVDFNPPYPQLWFQTAVHWPGNSATSSRVSHQMSRRPRQAPSKLRCSCSPILAIEGVAYTGPTIPAMSVEAKRAFSAAGVLCTKLSYVTKRLYQQNSYSRVACS